MTKPFADEQIISNLKEAEAGMPIEKLCRKYGIAEETFSAWRQKYDGLEDIEADCLKTLDELSALDQSLGLYD